MAVKVSIVVFSLSSLSLFSLSPAGCRPTVPTVPPAPLLPPQMHDKFYENNRSARERERVKSVDLTLNSARSSTEREREREGCPVDGHGATAPYRRGCRLLEDHHDQQISLLSLDRRPNPRLRRSLPGDQRNPTFLREPRQMERPHGPHSARFTERYSAPSSTFSNAQKPETSYSWPFSLSSPPLTAAIFSSTISSLDFSRLWSP